MKREIFIGNEIVSIIESSSVTKNLFGNSFRFLEKSNREFSKFMMTSPPECDRREDVKYI